MVGVKAARLGACGRGGTCAQAVRLLCSFAPTPATRPPPRLVTTPFPRCPMPTPMYLMHTHTPRALEAQ